MLNIIRGRLYINELIFMLRASVFLCSGLGYGHEVPYFIPALIINQKA